MTLSPIDIIISQYAFSDREKAGLTKNARSYINDTFSEDKILFIGFGGTISSGYSPSKETIVPLIDSPAIKIVEYVNISEFQISSIIVFHYWLKIVGG